MENPNCWKIHNAIKTKIYDLLIHVNLYFTDKSTKKRLPIFLLTNSIFFINIQKVRI